MKRVDLSLLLFWVGAACATGSTSPPLGQPPAPYLTSAGEPTAWTLGETDAALRRAIERGAADHSDRRITTTYYVGDQVAAEQLADWFRGRQGVAAVTLRDGGSRTHARGGGTEQAGAVSIAEQQWWELAVAGPPGPLAEGDVSGWLLLLRAVPTDIRWRLGPSDVAAP
jgi:hypothetical protein